MTIATIVSIVSIAATIMSIGMNITVLAYAISQQLPSNVIMTAILAATISFN